MLLSLLLPFSVSLWGCMLWTCLSDEHTSPILQRLKIVTRMATWTGYGNAYDYPSRKGNNKKRRPTTHAIPRFCNGTRADHCQREPAPGCGSRTPCEATTDSWRMKKTWTRSHPGLPRALGTHDAPLDVDELDEPDPDDAELELDDSTFIFALIAFRTAASAAFFCVFCSSSALSA